MDATVLFCTVCSAGQRRFDDKNFDVCIIDEATLLAEPQVVTVLKRPLECLVLAGDHCQLPATVISQRSKKLQYGSSLFERFITETSNISFILDTQYRMDPKILKFPNEKYYAGKIKNAANVSDKAYSTKAWSERYPSLCFIDASRGSEDFETGSFGNRFEAMTVDCILKNIRSLHRKSSPQLPVSVGVICPYTLQVARLSYLQSLSDESFQVNVCSIDSCQGQEFDIVILSTVRANAEGNFGFLKTEWRRLNVAITRPKHTLIVVCNVQTATAAKAVHWIDLIAESERQSGFHGVQSLLTVEVSRPWFKREVESLDDPSLGLDMLTWKLIPEPEFKTAFLRCSVDQRRDIYSAMLELGSGKWPLMNTSCVSGNSRMAGIVQHLIRPKNIRIIWTVNVVQSMECPKQYLQLWAIVSTRGCPADVMKPIEHRYAKFTEEYLDRCRVRKIDVSNDKRLNIPTTFDPDPSFPWFQSQPSTPIVQSMMTRRCRGGAGC
jgi:hypothetical protein